MRVRMSISCVLCFVLAAASGIFYDIAAASPSDASALDSVALAFVNNVANIRLKAYDVAYDCKGPIDSFLYPGHTEAMMKLVLTGANGHVEVELEFIDGCLVSYRLNSENGVPILNTIEPLDVLDVAKETLRRYQPVSKGTPCLQLMAMIDRIAVRHKGQSVQTDYTTLSFEPDANSGNGCTLIWNCRNASRKSVGVGINRHGFLDWFRDTWRLYRISDVKVNVSEETAVKIADDQATEYINGLGAKVAQVNVTFAYINSYPECRGQDCFVLYPSWTVEYIFDRFYSDGSNGVCITGYLVGIWADLCEVRTAMPQGFWGQVSQGETDSAPARQGLMVVPLIVVFGALLLTIQRLNKKRAKTKHA